MEVELVDDVAPDRRRAAADRHPPPPSQAPEIGEAEPIEPAPAPMHRARAAAAARSSRRRPRPTPDRQARPAGQARRGQARRPPRLRRPSPPRARAAPPRVADRRRFPQGHRRRRARRRARRAKPAAATFNAAAKADVASAIAAQIRPCALRQRALGEGANRIRVVLNIRLTLAGRLKGAPTVVRTSGVDEDNSQYEELVKDQAIASYRECAPLRLPAELYDRRKAAGRTST